MITVKPFKILLIICSLFFLSCNDEFLQTEVSASIKQVGKCINQGLNKTANDCFEYTFKDNLIIQFCVNGNCCPDTARFVSNYKINGDQITILVKDIAPNLCKCNCNYIIEADFVSILQKSYLVNCYQEKSEGNILLYSRTISFYGK